MGQALYRFFEMRLLYNTIQISLFHSDHTNMTYEEYNTILKGGTYLNRQIKERERDRGGEEVKYKDINI